MTPSEVADKALAEAGFSPTDKERHVWHRSKGPEEQDDVVEFHYHAPSKWFKAELYGKVEDLPAFLNPISLRDIRKAIYDELWPNYQYLTDGGLALDKLICDIEARLQSTKEVPTDDHA